jgi:NAD(P)-dependent dehydrogenase (short-subunit alcohol dehydrogenase family)
MPGMLAGKVALVTGAASGIGRASAIAFAREGAKVAVSDVDERGGKDTVHRIQHAGGQAAFFNADVSKSDEVEMLIEKTIQLYSHLDCAHNNAGIWGDTAATANCAEKNWDQVMSINLKGIYLCMKYEIIHMLEQGRGTIVNTSSSLGLIGARNNPAYSASKHGVIGLTKSAALEYAEDGIRINAVCPGLTRTPMAANLMGTDPLVEAQRMSAYPMGRMGDPTEIAEAVLWLSTDAASFVTGHAMVVDGGRTIG